jgi:hypothetical protein
MALQDNTQGNMMFKVEWWLVFLMLNSIVHVVLYTAGSASWRLCHISHNARLPHHNMLPQVTPNPRFQLANHMVCLYLFSLA